MKDWLTKIHKDVLNLFTYVPDKIIHPDHFDRWISFADLVEKRESFQGDCDDFCLTTAELLIRQNIPKDKIKIIFCKVETEQAHLVTGCTHWILDNRYKSIKYWKDLPYTWISSMRMDEIKIWRKL